MDSKEKQALFGLLLSLLLTLGLVLAGSQGGEIVFGVPLFAACAALSVFIQWLAFVPAYLQQSERYYDLTGSLTFLAVLATVLWLGPNPGSRSILLMSLISIWTIRLGSFLFRRIHAAGADRRFAELKTSFLRFLLTWTLQAVWVIFCLAAALAAMTNPQQVDLGLPAMLGTLLWITGFSLEVVADYQKRQFRKQPENQGRFISSGLWAWSRHPNYFGEILLWTGIALIALPALHGWQYLTLISPVFVILLLTRVSGIPLLEERADEQWGGRADYEAYKANTPVLIPRPPVKKADGK